MKPHLVKAAAEVIEASSPAKPADAALREYFREVKTAREDSAAISDLVFTYFRWRGWLNTEDWLEPQIKEATELQDRFDRDPPTFSDMDLTRAVPSWAKNAVTVTPGWLRSLQARPKMWLRSNVPGSELGSDFLKGPLPDSFLYSGREDLFRTEQFANGQFEIQDLASQAVGHVCNPQPGQTVWDACAGEGGKTIHLSILMRNKGLIWASDKAQWRLNKLKQRAGRAKVFNYRAEIWDGSAKLPTRTKFDLILVDAPCSGVGTWSRNPHARWTTTEKDVQELAELQFQLLTHASAALKPNGKLIYSVCTLTHAETTGVTERIKLKPFATTNPFTGVQGFHHWFWNHEIDANGMFVAGWSKT